MPRGRTDWFGPRLPIADPPRPTGVPCDRDPRHTGGIRFELHRYGQRVGLIRLCGPCFQDLHPRTPVDPLHVRDDAA